ncbi:Poly [ADP-ribose] polymerase 12, partial [Armadillidium nasatum]
NNQRGSQSLSNLSKASETKYSANSGAKPKNFQKTFQKTSTEFPRSTHRPTASAPPRAPPSAPPMAPPNAPPSYEQSVQQQAPYSAQPLFSNPPPLMNNPYQMHGYSQNYQMPGAGYQAPQPPLYSNHPRPARPFYKPERFQYKGPQQRFPGTGHNPQRFQQAPKPTPRTSIQNKSGNTDSSFDSKSQKQDKDDKKKIDINAIVRKLSECDRYFSFLKSLSQKLEINSSDLLKIVKEEDEVFSNMYDSSKKDSVIELCPKIEMCKDHQEKGCIVKDCCKIHLCEDFIFSNCTRKDCPLGHMSNFKSNHNTNILKKYYMTTLPNLTLQQLFQKICNRTVPPKICFDYHHGKCQFADNCTNIHICDSYVNNLGLCSDNNCSLSHNIRDPKIVATFKALGISTNESPRDLLKVLKDMFEEKEEVSDDKEPEKVSKDMPIEKEEVSDDKENSLGKDAQKSKAKKNKTKKSAGANQQTENSTSYCTNFHGSVKFPKVCIDGMKQKCNYVRNGCHYLHCRHKSHWQFGNDDKWYNFHLYHSQILDTKFSDPNCEDLDLPKLDYSRLNPTQRDLITVLGKKSLKIDFNKMTLHCESLDKTYSLRNLTTNSSVLGNNDDDLENYTVFKWYFKDDDGQYKLFDNNDSSSSIIEKAYLKDPNTIAKFNSANFSYSIDFIKMTQENESTHKISASAGAGNCSPDSDGKKILLIAEVIIGKVAQGSPGLTRPPENPFYNCMYDSTADNIQTPSVYVKYSTLEYYPAYIVEFI